jgi:hypothetical protein
VTSRLRGEANKKAVPDEGAAFLFFLKKPKLLVFMPHLLPLLPVLVLPNFFSSLLDHTAHAEHTSKRIPYFYTRTTGLSTKIQ